MSDATSNNSQNVGISDAENAEIDAQINASQSTDISSLTLEEAYAEMIRLMNKRLSDGGFEDREKYISVTRRFDELIKPEIAKASNINYSHTDIKNGEYIDADEIIRQDLLRNNPIPENLSTVAQRNTHVVQSLINNTPSLKSFSLDDAVKFANGDEDEMAIRIKFKDADPDILLTVAYTLLDSKQEDLEKSYSEFALEHNDTDFLDMASTNVLYKAESSKDYINWSDIKLEKIAEVIANDASISNKLSMIKSPDNIHSTQDIVEQYQIRQQLTDEIGEVYAKAYGLSTFNKDDIHFLSKSFDDYLNGSALANSLSTILGVKDDEAIISSYHPVYDLARSRKLFSETSDNNSTITFLKTTLEELQHTTDNIYADKLLNGELDPSHPAFDHTSIFALNVLNYTKSSDSHDLYKAQYTERSAKTTADNMAFEIMFQIEEKENSPDNQTPQANTTQDAGSFTNDQIIGVQPEHTRLKF